MKSFIEDLKRKGISEAEAIEINRILNEAQNNWTASITEIHESKDWERSIKYFVEAYFAMNHVVEFTSVNSQFLITKAIFQPIIDDMMGFLLNFLLDMHFKQKNQKAVEELKRMVGE